MCAEACLLLLGSWPEVADLLVDAGELDDILQFPMVNRSFLANSLRMSPEELTALDDMPSDENLWDEVRACDRVLKRCADLGFDDLNLRELELAIRMNRFAAYRCLGDFSDCPDTGAELARNFEKLWKLTSRSGGLLESLDKQKGLQ